MVNRDQQHLNVLSICWYVFGGMGAMAGLFPLLWVAIGTAFIFGSAAGPGGDPPPSRGDMWTFVLVGLSLTLACWIGAFLCLLAGRSLTRHRRLRLCRTVAALACLQIPIGTCLGVFTLVVLSRPTVKASFT